MNLPLAEHRNIYYQHDGASPHRTLPVMRFLDASFNDKWIANNGPILWPPRSPDLTALDYFIWGTIKNIVYLNPLPTQQDCMERVRQAVA